MQDKATSSLDADSERRITNALETCYRGRPRIVVAHRLSTVHNADLIIVFHHGQVDELGTHAQIVFKCGCYSQLIQNQLDLADGK